MTKLPAKAPIRVIVNLKRVKASELTPAQRQLAKKFWARLISQVKDERKAEISKQVDSVLGLIEEQELMKLKRILKALGIDSDEGETHSA